MIPDSGPWFLQRGEETHLIQMILAHCQWVHLFFCFNVLIFRLNSLRVPTQTEHKSVSCCDVKRKPAHFLVLHAVQHLMRYSFTVLARLGGASPLRREDFLHRSQYVRSYSLKMILVQLMAEFWYKWRISGAFFSTDTRTTQWEDPRLKNSAITGPVSILCEILTKLISILWDGLKVSNINLIIEHNVLYR